MFDNDPWHPDQLEDYAQLKTDAERLRFFECNGVDPAHKAEYLRLKFPPPQKEPKPSAHTGKPEQNHSGTSRLSFGLPPLVLPLLSLLSSDRYSGHFFSLQETSVFHIMHTICILSI